MEKIRVIKMPGGKYLDCTVGTSSSYKYGLGDLEDAFVWLDADTRFGVNINIVHREMGGEIVTFSPEQKP